MGQATPTASVFSLSDQSGAVHTGPFFDVVHPILHLSSTPAATFQSPLKNCFWQAVVARDVAKPSQLPPFHCGEKGFLGTSQ